MDAELIFISRTAAATEQLGYLIGLAAEAGLVIALDGEMGTGKTTLVRGLGRGLELEDSISSPTYTLMHSYRGRLELYHFDAWMEGREAAFLDGGGAEWFNAGGVSVVEWASRVRNYLPVDRLELELEHLGAPRFEADGQLDPDQERGVRVHAGGPLSRALLCGLSRDVAADPLFQAPS